MSFINVEIKARCENTEAIEKVLLQKQAKFIGEDHQVDTYYEVAEGRLKMRTGNIENSLIFYQRPNTAGPKKSDISMYQDKDLSVLKTVLDKALSIWVVVDKQRRIFFVDNVKFHLDRVTNLGTFMEIEAIDRDGSLGADYLRAQVDEYMQLFGIAAQDLQENSYSDMLARQ